MNDNKKNPPLWEGVWFLVRWATGLVIDAFLLLGSIYISFAVMMVMFSMGQKLTPGVWPVLQNPFALIIIGVTVFTALMSGRNWARGQYYTHILPEVWENTIQDLIEKAKNEHKE